MAVDHIADPLVSVVIPVYNAGDTIAATISSVLAQTWTATEIIIVDDGSTDDTARKAAMYVSRGEVRLIHQENRGAAAARNNGYRHSRGRFIKFLDGDDLINPEMIEQQVSLARQFGGYVISSAWGRFFNDDLETFRPHPEPCWQDLGAAEWLCSSWQNTSSMTTPGIFLIPRQVIEKAGLWDEELSLLDDTEYFARTILASKGVIFSPASTLYYRSGSQGSLSAAKTRQARESAYRAYEKTTAMILAAKPGQESSRICANIWQLFIYDCYPFNQDLVKKAEQHLGRLEKPGLAYPFGRAAHWLSLLIGWKATKRLQLILKK